MIDLIIKLIIIIILLSNLVNKSIIISSKKINLIYIIKIFDK